jgi:hypothetical protein
MKVLQELGFADWDFGHLYIAVKCTHSEAINCVNWLHDQGVPLDHVAFLRLTGVPLDGKCLLNVVTAGIDLVASALSISDKEKSLQMLRCLHRLGVNLNHCGKNGNEQQPPGAVVWHALNANNVPLLEFLCDIGINFKVRDEKGNAPYHCAKSVSALRVVHLVLEGDLLEVVNHDGCTPLRARIKGQQGAWGFESWDSGWYDGDGRKSPAEYKDGLRTECAKALISFGADPLQTIGVAGTDLGQRTLVHTALEAVTLRSYDSEGACGMLGVLAASGCDMSVQLSAILPITVAHIAARSCDSDFVRVLHAASVPLNRRDHNGCCPWHWIMMNRDRGVLLTKRIDCLQTFKECGCDVGCLTTPPAGGPTAMSIAHMVCRMWPSTAVFMAFHTMGIDMGACDGAGRSVLQTLAMFHDARSARREEHEACMTLLSRLTCDTTNLVSHSCPIPCERLHSCQSCNSEEEKRRSFGVLYGSSPTSRWNLLVDSAAVAACWDFGAWCEHLLHGEETVYGGRLNYW